MNTNQLLALCQSKGLAEIPNDIAVYDDGFIFLQPINIGEGIADYLLVGRLNERWSVALLKGVMRTIKERKRLMVTQINGNHDEMFKAVVRTNGEFLANGNCFWRV